MIKRYGVPFEPEEASANQEALEGSAGLSASGGIDSDGSWDDEVEDMNFSSEEVTEDELEPISEVSAEEIYDQENSLEDIAGIEIKADETSVEEVSAMLEEDQHQDEKPNAPPVQKPDFLKVGLWNNGNGMVTSGLQKMAGNNYRQTIGNEFFKLPNSSPLYIGFPSSTNVFIMSHNTPFQDCEYEKISIFPAAAETNNFPSSVCSSNNARTRFLVSNK